MIVAAIASSLTLKGWSHVHGCIVMLTLHWRAYVYYVWCLIKPVICSRVQTFPWPFSQRHSLFLSSFCLCSLKSGFYSWLLTICDGKNSVSFTALHLWKLSVKEWHASVCGHIHSPVAMLSFWRLAFALWWVSQLRHAGVYPYLCIFTHTKLHWFYRHELL